MVLISAVLATEVAAGRSGGVRPAGLVRLTLAQSRLRAGQVVQVSAVNEASVPLIATACFVLQLREQGAWKTIGSTHGISVPCTRSDPGPPQAARSEWKLPLMLYDDLRRGSYRITLRYKFLPRHWHVAGLEGHLRQVHTTLTVLAFHPGPAPHLPDRRIRRTALQAARNAGDPHPTLIQHAEGTRYEADWVASQDQVFDWSWAYLVAIRGRFEGSSEPGSYALQRPESESASGFSVIALVLDANTGRVEDFGVTNHYPALSRLGPVTTDYGHP
jgi:hypothetical protein